MLQKKKLRSLSGASVDNDGLCQETKEPTKKFSEKLESLGLKKRRRSTKVITKLQRMKAKVNMFLHL